MKKGIIIALSGILIAGCEQKPKTSVGAEALPVPRDQVATAFLRHATSKVQTADEQGT